MIQSMVAKVVENEKARLTVSYDVAVENPREWSNLGTFYTWERWANSPDDHDYADPRDFLESLYFNFYPDADPHKVSMKSSEDLLRRIRQHVIILPVFKYEHGGVAYRTEPFTCKWDSGQVGWIFVEKQLVRKELGIERIGKRHRDRIINVLKSEVEVYTHYMNGDVFYFELEEKHPEYGWITAQVCGGFYGWDFRHNGLIDHIPDEHKDLISLL